MNFYKIKGFQIVTLISILVAFFPNCQELEEGDKTANIDESSENLYSQDNSNTTQLENETEVNSENNNDNDESIGDGSDINDNELGGQEKNIESKESVSTNDSFNDLEDLNLEDTPIIFLKATSEKIDPSYRILNSYQVISGVCMPELVNLQTNLGTIIDGDCDDEIWSMEVNLTPGTNHIIISGKIGDEIKEEFFDLIFDLAPETPVLSSLERTNEGINIKWKKATDDVTPDISMKYHLYRKENTEDKFAKLSTIIGADTYTDAATDDNKIYQYKVLSEDAAGNKTGEHKNILSITGKTVVVESTPPPPRLLSLNFNKSTFTKNENFIANLEIDRANIKAKLIFSASGTPLNIEQAGISNNALQILYNTGEYGKNLTYDLTAIQLTDEDNSSSMSYYAVSTDKLSYKSSTHRINLAQLSISFSGLISDPTPPVISNINWGDPLDQDNQTAHFCMTIIDAQSNIGDVLVTLRPYNNTSVMLMKYLKLEGDNRYCIDYTFNDWVVANNYKIYMAFIYSSYSTAMYISSGDTSSNYSINYDGGNSTTTLLNTSLDTSNLPLDATNPELQTITMEKNSYESGQTANIIANLYDAESSISYAYFIISDGSKSITDMQWDVDIEGEVQVKIPLGYGFSTGELMVSTIQLKDQAERTIYLMASDTYSTQFYYDAYGTQLTNIPIVKFNFTGQPDTVNPEFKSYKKVEVVEGKLNITWNEPSDNKDLGQDISSIVRSKNGEGSCTELTQENIAVEQSISIDIPDQGLESCYCIQVSDQAANKDYSKVICQDIVDKVNVLP